jgi:ankyrin repeat protein
VSECVCVCACDCFARSWRLFCRDDSDRTALFYVVARNSQLAVDFLAQRHAVLAQTETSGYSVAHYGAFYGAADAIDMLFSISNSIQHINWPKASHMAPISPIIAYVIGKGGRLEMIDAFVRAGWSVSSTDPNERTALHHAACRGLSYVCEHLLAYDKGLVDAKDKFGSPPLHLACAANRGRAVCVLLHFGANAAAVDLEGNNVLHIMASENALLSLQVLCRMKPALVAELLTQKNNEGLTPLEVECEERMHSVLMKLVELSGSDGA